MWIPKGTSIVSLWNLWIELCLFPRPKCQGALRTVFGLASFLTFGSAFSVMALLRFTELLSSGHEIDDEIWPILIRCGLQVTEWKIVLKSSIWRGAENSEWEKFVAQNGEFEFPSLTLPGASLIIFESWTPRFRTSLIWSPRLSRNKVLQFFVFTRLSFICFSWFRN